MQIAENFNHAFRTNFVHREGCAFPVARCAEFFQLFQDNSAVFVRPVPGVFQKLIARKVGFFDPFFSQTSHNFCFGSNGCVVGSGYPAGIFSLHTRTAHKYVLNGIVEHVPHVKHAGYVWWRNYDGVRFALNGRGMKKSIV